MYCSSVIMPASAQVVKSKKRVRKRKAKESSIASNPTRHAFVAQARRWDPVQLASLVGVDITPAAAAGSGGPGARASDESANQVHAAEDDSTEDDEALEDAQEQEDQEGEGQDDQEGDAEPQSPPWATLADLAKAYFDETAAAEAESEAGSEAGNKAGAPPPLAALPSARDEYMCGQVVWAWADLSASDLSAAAAAAPTGGSQSGGVWWPALVCHDKPAMQRYLGMCVYALPRTLWCGCGPPSLTLARL